MKKIFIAFCVMPFAIYGMGKNNDPENAPLQFTAPANITYHFDATAIGTPILPRKEAERAELQFSRCMLQLQKTELIQELAELFSDEVCFATTADSIIDLTVGSLEATAQSFQAKIAKSAIQVKTYEHKNYSHQPSDDCKSKNCNMCAGLSL